MRPLSRRGFLERGGRAIAGLGAAGVGATGLTVLVDDAAAQSAAPTSTDRLTRQAAKQAAMLFDSTLCVGCRSCEVACNKKNDLGRTTTEIFEGRDAQDARALAPNVFTYVTFHQWEADPSTAAFGKVQCMHCIEPACVSSCPAGALHKTPEGPVVWDGPRCLGCRYCMMACPFLVPRFEWESRNPRIRKCDMCWDRQTDGKAPACVEACPTKALRFGTRAELLQEAHNRIASRPRKYVHHVYGEHEAGGTSFLHIAGRPFDELGYRRNLPMRSYREYTRPAMATIPYVLGGLGLALGAVRWVIVRRQEVARGEAGTGEGRTP
jgi:formate dehydrogenase iron-sulfur subunit